MTGIKNGQASIELMVVLSVMLAIFTIMGAIVYKNYIRSNDLKIYISGTRLSNHVADQINTLNAVGDGFATTFTIPESMYGNTNYTINMYSNESQIFIEGAWFSTGGDLRFSSPISTGNVHCLREECTKRCNKTADEECLQVPNLNGTLELRLAKFAGGIYFTPAFNLAQDSLKRQIAPFPRNGPPDASTPDEIVRGGGDAWDVMYIHHNTADDTLSLVFSINNTAAGPAEITLSEVQGEFIRNTSNDAGEFEALRTLTPPGRWAGVGPDGDLDGGTMTFRGGFHACVTPSNLPGTWMFLSGDGRNFTLDKSRPMCITYP
jgi:hypothetical protein